MSSKLKNKSKLCLFCAATLFIVNCFINNTSAQNYVDNLYFDARVGFSQKAEINSNNNHYYKEFTGEYLNFNMTGHISKNITYLVRQRLNKNPFNNDNYFNGTDYLYVDWMPNEKWKLTIGKQTILYGGFEYDYAPINVYYWSEFCNVLPQCYAFAATAGYSFSPSQHLYLQISGSPYKLQHNDLLSYNLAWYGEVANWWKTIWSINETEYAGGKFMNIISLGNKFLFNNFYLDFDIMNRYAHGYEDFIGDLTYVAKLNYSYKSWNVFVKGGYDNMFPIEKNGNVYTPNTIKQEEYYHYGIGCEYFPLHNDNIRLHAVFYQYDNRQNPNDEDIYRLDIGATWKLNVIKNSKFEVLN